MNTVLHKRRRGFTLAELLIALAILGVIATFTIPKILTSSNNTKYNSIAKEDMAALAGALLLCQSSLGNSGCTTLPKIMNYVNYVVNDTGLNNVNDVTGYTSVTCGSGGTHCWQMHNGSVIWEEGAGSFSLDGNFSSYTVSGQPTMVIGLDPDGSYDTNFSLAVVLSQNGRLTTDSVTGLTGAGDPTWYHL